MSVVLRIQNYISPIPLRLRILSDSSCRKLSNTSTISFNLSSSFSFQLSDLFPCNWTKFFGAKCLDSRRAFARASFTHPSPSSSNPFAARATLIGSSQRLSNSKKGW
ncbi:hypothetical protein O6P43_008677 [Quillaja saponaria]|uniref:Uncharacterized protein n=1 Tax=Quillaja saponaria TaxID=32244 RepID=A0AAD7PWK3_QUISA|nr:hypothetical protein O6P43_008677 [Quillaja saponaria]